MKGKLLTLGFVVLLVPLLAGCGPVSITGSGNVVTQEEAITGFDKVDISQGFTVDISQGFTVDISQDDAFSVVALAMVPPSASSHGPSEPLPQSVPPAPAATSINYLPLVVKGWPPEYAKPRNVIIVIWDGTQRAHLLEMLDNGALPNLALFISQNAGLLLAYIDSETCEPGSGDGYRTQTGPGNSAIATGLGYPGMANWTNKDPHPIPNGLTLWEWFEGRGYITGIVCSKDADFWPHVPLTNAKPDMDSWEVGWLYTWVTDEGIEFIHRYRHWEFFLWVHYQEPDNVCHYYGENSPECDDALVRLDNEFSRLLSELGDHGLEEETLLVLTTDHGFTEGGGGHKTCDADTKDLFLAPSRIGARLFGCVETQTDIAPCIKGMM